MARIRLATSAEQIDRLVGALASTGWPVVNRFRASDRPVNLDVARDSGILPLRVFCWNITHGGAHRAPDEYRVQTTRPGDVPLYVGIRLDLALGYFRDLDVFVAWDAALHANPGGSSSLQVPLDQLEEAAARGFVARSRDLGQPGEAEVVVAFQPEAIRHYLESHGMFVVSDAEDADAIAAAVEADESVRVEDLPGDVVRQRAIVLVNRRARDARFRVRVLQAYGHRCAFCGLGARLGIAAHLHAVAQGGADQVVNGVVACPTHHAALDRGLILIWDDYALTVNRPRAASLEIAEADMDALEGGMSDRLNLPEDQALRPSPANLQALRGQWL